MRRYLYFVIIPIVIGALPYIFLRKDPSAFIVATQTIFNTYLGFDFTHRQILHLDSNWNWVVYNLPDALWAFSLTSFVLLATRNDIRKTKLIYLSVSITMMLAIEFLVGTIDLLDFAALVIGFCISMAILRLEPRNKGNGALL